MNPIVTKTVQGEKVCSNLSQSRPDYGMIRNEVWNTAGSEPRQLFFPWFPKVQWVACSALEVIWKPVLSLESSEMINSSQHTPAIDPSSAQG
jgi:hypothetical protein